MTDKLAEEILDEAHKISSAMPLSALQKHFTYLAMQRYHKAKMKEEVRKCVSCGSPLNDYCERCQHLMES